MALWMYVDIIKNSYLGIKSIRTLVAVLRSVYFDNHRNVDANELPSSSHYKLYLIIYYVWPFELDYNITIYYVYSSDGV